MPVDATPADALRQKGIDESMGGTGHGGEMETLILGEDALGHTTYLRTLETYAVASSRDATVLRLDPTARLADRDRRVVGRLAGNYSVRISRTARATILAHAQPELRSVMVHTQTAALLLPRRLTASYVISTDCTPMNLDEMAAGYDHQKGAPVIEAAKRAVVAHAFRRAARVVSFSEWAARSIREDYGVAAERVVVIPPGVPSQRLAGRTESPHDAPLRLLFIGGDFERKGGFVLLEAVERIDHCEVDVITRTDVAASERVRVHRDVTAENGRLDALLAQSDVMVLPTEADMFSFACLEAMSAGLPVIATSVGGIPEIVSEGTTGLLVRPGDVRALIEAIQLLQRDVSLRRSMGDAGRQRWQTHFSATTQSAKVFALLDAVAAPRDPGGHPATAAGPPII